MGARPAALTGRGAARRTLERARSQSAPAARGARAPARPPFTRDHALSGAPHVRLSVRPFVRARRSRIKLDYVNKGLLCAGAAHRPPRAPRPFVPAAGAGPRRARPLAAWPLPVPRGPSGRAALQIQIESRVAATVRARECIWVAPGGESAAPERETHTHCVCARVARATQELAASCEPFVFIKNFDGSSPAFKWPLTSEWAARADTRTRATRAPDALRARAAPRHAPAARTGH